MAFLQLRNAQNVAEGMSHYVYLGVVCGLQLQKSYRDLCWFIWSGWRFQLCALHPTKI